MLTRWELRGLLQQNDEAARLAILRHDEAAVEPLIDEFYSGVSEATGLQILDLLSRIGGYEARALLLDVAENGSKSAWREAAAQGAAANGWTHT